MSGRFPSEMFLKARGEVGAVTAEPSNSHGKGLTKNIVGVAR